MGPLNEPGPVRLADQPWKDAYTAQGSEEVLAWISIYDPLSTKVLVGLTLTVATPDGLACPCTVR